MSKQADDVAGADHGAPDGDLEAREAAVRAEVGETREARRSAQRELAATGALRLAVERAARDRSSGTTDQIEVTRDRAQQLFDEIGDLIGAADDQRSQVARLRQAYPTVPVPPRLLEAFAAEAAWRQTVNADFRSQLARLHLPRAGELR